MAGILSYGAYLPYYRLSRETIAKAWGGRPIGGERCVANHDEDSLTMAVEAATDCVRDVDRQDIDGFFFASTTSPYKEKLCSPVAATALDLGAKLITADYANSLRAGTSALRAALDAVKSGSARSILVAAADCRLGAPQSEMEQRFGDAAAALLIGDGRVVATVEASYSLSHEMADVWRKEQDKFVRTWEDRWVITYGYTENMQKAVSGLMKEQGLSAKDFAKAVLSAPDARSQQGLARNLGFDIKTQLQDPLINTVGEAGAAQALLMLVAALEEAKPGDRILLASYGDGCDAFSLKVTEEIARCKGKCRFKAGLTFKRPLPTYEKYLVFRGLVGEPLEIGPYVLPSAPAMWRTQDWVLRGHASKCRRCGLVTFPIQRVCYRCQSKDEFDQVRLSDKKGKVFTYSLDSLAGVVDPPLIQTIVEMEDGGARVYTAMTDCDTQEVKVGLPVELTFRRMHEGGGFLNYFWKCRPIRGGQ